MLRRGPDGHICSATATPSKGQLEPTELPSCLALAKVSIPSSCALPSFPLMTYLTIINPESNGDEPGERLMAPSARYTCSATKLWPNRRPRSPMSKINTAPSPVASGDVHGGDAATCSPTTTLIMRFIGGGKRRPSFAPFFLCQLAAPSVLTAAHLPLRGEMQMVRLTQKLVSAGQSFHQPDPFRRGGDGESAHLGISQHTGAI